MASEASQRRYWARSFVGWQEFANVAPNGTHEGMARLQAAGWLPEILTQNVDRLHQKAGAARVLEIHGTTHECAAFCSTSAHLSILRLSACRAFVIENCGSSHVCTLPAALELTCSCLATVS